MKKHGLVQSIRWTFLVGSIAIVTQNGWAGQACQQNSSSSACANEQFVSSLYTVALGRSADEGGLDYWTNLLNTSALTRAAVTDAFYKSAESCTIFVTQVYRTTLQREPDNAGLAYWVGQCVNGVERGTISATFENSKEFHDNYSSVSYDLVNKSSLDVTLKDVGLQILGNRNPQTTSVNVSLAPGEHKSGNLTWPSLSTTYWVSASASGATCILPTGSAVNAVNGRFPTGKTLVVTIESFVTAGPTPYKCTIEMK